MPDEKRREFAAKDLPRLYVDNGDGTFSELVAVTATIEVGDLQIGAVEFKDATTDTRAKVAVGTAIVAGDAAVAVRDAGGPAAPTNATSVALEKSRVIKASAGTLYGVTGYNSAAYGQYVQLHDAAAVPADTAVPKVVQWVEALSPFSFDFGVRGRGFAAGIVVCSSSTLATKTLGASSDCWFDGQYA